MSNNAFIVQIVVGHLGRFLCPDECKRQTAGKENTVADSSPSGNKQQIAQRQQLFLFSYSQSKVQN